MKLSHITAVIQAQQFTIGRLACQIKHFLKIEQRWCTGAEPGLVGVCVWISGADSARTVRAKKSTELLMESTVVLQIVYWGVK